MRIARTNELFLDVRKLNVPDLAAVLVEERRAANSERIKPYKTWIGIDGQTPFPVGTETELKRRELAGLKAVAYLARKGHRTIIWISPPGGSIENDKCLYDETRMIAYQLDSIEETRVNFSCVAICSQQTPSECLSVAQELLNDGGEARGEPIVADDLRSEPIALTNEVVDWVSYLEEKMPELGSVWEAIRGGFHCENSRQAWLMADVVVRQFSERASRVNSRLEAVILGVELERTIYSLFKIRLMAGGVHGSSNEAALGAFGTTYNEVSEESDSRLQKCSRCGDYFMKKKEKCPKCGV